MGEKEFDSTEDLIEYQYELNDEYFFRVNQNFFGSKYILEIYEEEGV